MRSLRLQRQREHLADLDRHFADLRIEAPSAGSFEGWFLGPKAENQELLTQLILEAVWKHSEHRRAYRPSDPTYITDETKDSPEYKAAVERLRHSADELFSQLQLSAPLASMRSQGHMLWDQVLPGMVGYFGAMLYNQNNVAAEASPLTTELEIRVGNDLCRMLGFPLSYVLFGAETEAFLVHRPVKKPHFDHVVTLAASPAWLPPDQLRAGVPVNIPQISDHLHCKSPLQNGLEYEVRYAGFPAMSELLTVRVGRTEWFCTKFLNFDNPCREDEDSCRAAGPFSFEDIPHPKEEQVPVEHH